MPPTFAASYLAEKTGDFDFLPRPFWRSEERQRSAEDAALWPCPPNLPAILTDQALAWGASSSTLAAIRDLRLPGTLAVITGQQTGLFGGPLYSLYKAASAIRLARHLEAEGGQRFVPIFWLQTEDHDLLEIASTYLPKAGAEPLRFALPPHEGPEPPRISVKHHLLPPAISDLLTSLRHEIGFLPHASEILDALETFYRPGTSITDAFARLLTWFFEDEGLVLIDPRHPAISDLTASVHRKAILEAPAIYQALDEQSRRLTALDFDIQIPLRPASCLSFFHPDGPLGPRYRLTFGPDGYSLAGRDSFRASASDLLEALEEEPLVFSTSALLRPITQDLLFPTFAYLGGPGEISYFAQIPPLYALFQRPMPLILPRARFVLLEESTSSALSHLGLSVADLALPLDTIFQRLQTQTPSDPFAPEALKERLFSPLSATLDQILRETERLDPDLKKAFEKNRRSLEDDIDKLIARIQRARLTSNDGLQRKLSLLKQRLWPLAAPQERIFGFPFFLARFGKAAFKDALFAAYEPFSSSLREIRL